MAINALQSILREATGKELQFTGDFHAYWDQLGIPPGGVSWTCRGPLFPVPPPPPAKNPALAASTEPPYKLFFR